ncbi:MAG: plastocyanin/azurin family copper-binding protein [Gammaproteobacteria bacterium]|nr:plastocyanin/azurin family copper-binding protein [Gammaproteobacteria bacterium]
MKNGTIQTAGCLLAAAVVSPAQAAGMSGMSSNTAGHDRFGSPGTAQAVTRTVRITALDTMHYSPPQISVRPGRTVRFVVHNGGHLTHEFVIGDRAEQRAHEAEMEARPGMKMGRDPNGMTILTGHTRTLIWRFPRHAGTLEYACHEPGHFAAGMVGYIHVTAAAPGGAK